MQENYSEQINYLYDFLLSTQHAEKQLSEERKLQQVNELKR